MFNTRVISLLATSLLSFVLIGCREIPTSVKLNTGPSFILHGSGRLASFRIYGPEAGRRIATPFNENSLIWRLEPVDGYYKGSRVQNLTIAYGRNLQGYRQTIPVDGRLPIALTEGRIYYLFAETTNAPPAEMFFYLEGSIPSGVRVPGLCQSGFVGDVRPLKCGTNELYSEPKDFARFIRENRIEK